MKPRTHELNRRQCDKIVVYIFTILSACFTSKPTSSSNQQATKVQDLNRTLLNLLSMLLDTLLRLWVVLHTLLGSLDSSSNIDISLFLGDSTEDNIHIFERSTSSLGKEESAGGGNHTEASEEEELFG